MRDYKIETQPVVLILLFYILFSRASLYSKILAL